VPDVLAKPAVVGGRLVRNIPAFSHNNPLQSRNVEGRKLGLRKRSWRAANQFGRWRGVLAG